MQLYIYLFRAILLKPRKMKSPNLTLFIIVVEVFEIQTITKNAKYGRGEGGIICKILLFSKIKKINKTKMVNTIFLPTQRTRD